MTSAVRNKGREHPGPPLSAPAIGFVLFFLASLIIGPLVGHGATPSPFSSPDVIQHYFATNTTASQVNGFLQLGSGFMLLLFSGILLSRLQFLAPNAPGPTLASVGGIAAAILMMVNGAIQWVLGQPGMTDQPVLVRALQYLFFICGGPAHTAALGVLVLGMAATSWFLNRQPRWLVIAGIVIGTIAVLSVITMLAPAAAPLIPIGRFTGMLWIVVMSLLTPRDRGARRLADTPAQAADPVAP